MNDSNFSSDGSAPRSTLKLKVAPRKSREDQPAPKAPAAPLNPKSKPGAHWSDEYKSRMQADMDALVRK